jgi:hypothetical protein
MKRIFRFEKGWSTANCNERDKRIFKFEKDGAQRTVMNVMKGM